MINFKTFLTKLHKSRLCFVLPIALICYAYVSLNYTVWYNIGMDIKHVHKLVTVKPVHNLSSMKYILLWTPKDYSPFYNFKTGQEGFLQRNCSYTNCYVTDDRNLLGDVTKFHAIAFNARNLKTINWSGMDTALPAKRSPHQIYIYISSESARNYLICIDDYKNFFNWTCTYKLDSDIPMPYIIVKDTNGVVVAPKRNLEWVKANTGNTDQDFNILKNKTKAVVWFVSNCYTSNKREFYAMLLYQALALYNLTIDVYGSCGHLKCPKFQKECDKLIENYFFSLAFENSNAEDYVTEKAGVAMNFNSVPIVLGGANYSWFLPPGSYIDAHELTPMALADLIYRTIQSPELYLQYFRWRQHYTVHVVTDAFLNCDLCAALHNTSMVQTPKTYEDIRSWWYPEYREVCDHHYRLMRSIVCVLILFCGILIVVLKAH